MPQAKTQALIARMLSFDGQFDGYPTMSCADEGLIEGALEENPGQSVLALVCYLASEHVTNPEQYRASRAFVRAWVDTCWECNMSEGSNPVHAIQPTDD